ncbi:transglycosylase SLT domain-containing protein [Alkanindiges sp. WGS2144]|uniref:transglycosylase SLT domain-containing protein n=1 Tax=Alkanindiges sp. WGS2144 TaxID=3366808 RepID=UPI0037523E0C
MRHNPDGSKAVGSTRLASTLRLAALSTVFLPLHSFSNAPVTQYDRMLSNKTLTVVSVPGSSTFFNEDQFLHGFGYDLARAYALDLNVSFKFKTAKSTSAALDMVKKGQADFALTTALPKTIEAKSLIALNVSCGDIKTLQQHGLDTNLSWAFKDATDPLAAAANGFICNTKQQGKLSRMAAFYDRNVMNNYAKQAFYKDITTRLPVYKASFQKTAKQHKLDWHLLAAIGYQESYLNPASVSPTGVTGLMMLTQNTAKAMGVADRRDPVQSIQGGGQYFRLMLTQYKAVPEADRLWFALAAYNMGPGALDNVRKLVKRSGRNPNNWVDVYAYLSSHSKANPRYKQCMTYVTRIRAYLENIKQDQKLARI